LQETIENVAAHSKLFLPIIGEFQNLIESDPAIDMLFHAMFAKVPPKYKNPKLPSGALQRRSAER
jgi:hypothetical protein